MAWRVGRAQARRRRPISPAMAKAAAPGAGITPQLNSTEDVAGIEAAV